MAGRPIWYELMTPDAGAVAPFYKAVLGWDMQALGTATASGHPYWMIARADGGFAGGVLPLTQAMQDGGGKPGWLPYFQVADVAASAERAEELGGTVYLPPTTMEPGTMAMLGDPQGAPFYLMTPTPPPDQPDAQSDVFAYGTPGHCWWNQLDTSDEPGATAFYTALLGWNPGGGMPLGDAGTYRFIELDGQQIGAINPMVGAGETPHWLPYFGVADIVAARAAALANGGTLTQDIHEVPGDDMIFIATAPDGAPVGFVGKKGA